MRQHIAKSLQRRSKAVKNAITTYNELAAIQDPPKRQLSWEDVVEYTFIADFDLLRSREVLAQPWSRPAFRATMTRYFKTVRAREEIQRLNIEIRRVVTWIRDEGQYLREREAALRNTSGKSREQAEADLLLLVHVAEYRRQRQRFDATHMRRFRKLAVKEGFTGSIEPGSSLERPECSEEAMDVEEERTATTPLATRAPDATDEPDIDGSDNEGDDAHEMAVSELVFQIAGLGIDKEDRGPL
jgi:hypothetical protein